MTPLTRSAGAPRAFSISLLASLSNLKLRGVSYGTRKLRRARPLLSLIEAILAQIDKVPSPEKEFLLVDLILHGRENPRREELFQPSV